MHDIHKLGAGGPIHGAVVNLQQYGEAIGRVALDIIEPLDDVHLPQGLVPAQGLGMNARGQNTQLAPVTGLGQGNMPYMVFHVEVRILHPVGAAQAVGNKGQFAAENGRQVHAIFQHGQDLLEADHTPGGGGLIIDTHPANMLWQAIEFGVQEHGVLSG